MANVDRPSPLLNRSHSSIVYMNRSTTSKSHLNTSTTSQNSPVMNRQPKRRGLGEFVGDDLFDGPPGPRVQQEIDRQKDRRERSRGGFPVVAVEEKEPPDDGGPNEPA